MPLLPTSPHTGSFPGTPLYLIGFIEDTKGPFVFRLGGELKIINVLSNNLPVGDEVALGIHQQSVGVRHKPDTCLLTLGPETPAAKISAAPSRCPSSPRRDALPKPQCLISIGAWEHGWVAEQLAFHF